MRQHQQNVFSPTVKQFNTQQLTTVNVQEWNSITINTPPTWPRLHVHHRVSTIEITLIQFSFLLSLMASSNCFFSIINSLKPKDIPNTLMLGLQLSYFHYWLICCLFSIIIDTFFFFFIELISSKPKVINSGVSCDEDNLQISEAEIGECF